MKYEIYHPSEDQINKIVRIFERVEPIVQNNLLDASDFAKLKNNIAYKVSGVMAPYLAFLFGLEKARELAISAATLLQIFPEGGVDPAKISDSEKLADFAREMQATNTFFEQTLRAEVSKITLQELLENKFYSTHPHADIVFKLKLNPSYTASEVIYSAHTYFTNRKDIYDNHFSQALTLAFLYVNYTDQTQDITDITVEDFTESQIQAVWTYKRSLGMWDRSGIVVYLLNMIKPEDLDHLLKKLVGHKDGLTRRAI